eukprot:11029036-Ditylum_brightwellii.AAC.1
MRYDSQQDPHWCRQHATLYDLHLVVPQHVLQFVHSIDITLNKNATALELVRLHEAVQTLREKMFGVLVCNIPQESTIVNTKDVVILKAGSLARRRTEFASLEHEGTHANKDHDFEAFEHDPTKTLENSKATFFAYS